MLDLLGYIATAATLVSFTLNTQLKLRIVNSIGAVLWVIYGVFLESNPMILTNFTIIILNGYWLFKNRK
jgi:hypothetical protein